MIRNKFNQGGKISVHWKLKYVDEIHWRRQFPRLWVGRINIVKMPIPLKVIYRFNEISIKIPMNFLKIEKKNP